MVVLIEAAGMIAGTSRNVALAERAAAVSQRLTIGQYGIVAIVLLTLVQATTIVSRKAIPMYRRRSAALLACSLALAAPAARAGDHGEPSSPAQARAWQALEREFEEQVEPREQDVRAYATKIIRALQAWDLELLVGECVMYSSNAKDRAGLTRKYLEAHKAELQAAAALADPNAPDFGKQLSWRRPEPGAGMQGRVSVPFGPPAPAPANKRLVPPRHELELWWSGPLMPEANGPVHATPPPGSKPGHWRFHQLVLPYSRTDLPRL